VSTIGGESIYIGPGVEARGCEIHDWPTEGIAQRLVAEMRRTHCNGGVNACRECIDRAMASLPPRHAGSSGTSGESGSGSTSAG
jgi:hypothetical protein